MRTYGHVQESGPRDGPMEGAHCPGEAEPHWLHWETDPDFHLLLLFQLATRDYKNRALTVAPLPVPVAPNSVFGVTKSALGIW